LIWRRVTPKAVFSSPVVAGGRVYCGEGFHEDKDCNLYCLNATTGEVLFTVPSHSHVEGSPAVEGNSVVFSAGDDGVMCADSLTGKVLWHQSCGHCDSAPIIADGRVYVGTAYGADSALCLDLASGAVLWSKKMDLPVWGNPAVLGGKVCFGLGNGNFNNSDPHHPRGAAVCFECASGRQLWRTDVGDSINSALILDGSDVFFGGRDGQVFCLKLDDGTIRWRTRCGEPVLSSPILIGDTILAAGGDGSLHALRRAEGKPIWGLSISLVPLESSPMLAAGRLYIGAGSQVLCVGR
jgi:outer membrane protein assembly factor BamB